jgi:hypothetical protein
MTKAVDKSPAAEGIPFDNEINGFNADDVQGAIEEVAGNIGLSASPGFPFGRPSNVNLNTFLYRPGTVPSNKAGITFGLYNGSLQQINVGSEDVSTYEITIWQHDGDFINPIVIAVVNVTASRSESLVKGVDYTEVNAPVRGKQFAVQLTGGSAKNLGVDLQPVGTLTP